MEYKRLVTLVLQVSTTIVLLCQAKVPELQTIDNGTTWILVSDAGAVDVEYKNGQVFWIDKQENSINRIVLDTDKHTFNRDSFLTLIGSEIISPESLAVDWLNNKLYWTDSGLKTIEVGTLDGSLRKVLHWQNVYQPREIVLDPVSGYMFWIDDNTFPHIERAGMDGNASTRSIIIRGHETSISGLAVDPVNKRLFWTFVKTGELWISDLTGSNPKVISAGVKDIAGLTMHGDHVIWISRVSGTNIIYSKDILHDSNTTRIALSDDTPLAGVAALSPSWTGRVNPCGGGNGGCSDLCLITPQIPFYNCACATGIKLKRDGQTCEKGPFQQLLFVQRSRLGRMSLDTLDFTPFSMPVQFGNGSHLVDVDYDPINGQVYWTDEGHAGIRRAFLNGSGQETLFSTNVKYPDGIAVNFVHRMVYWTDRGTDTIEMGSLSGGHRQVVVKGKLDQPRAITVDPVKQFLFWTDWGEHPKIERARLHGGERRTIVGTGLRWPNGLARDFSDDRLFWADGRYDVIEVVKIDGTERRVVVGIGLKHIFGLTVLGEYIYWSDWGERSIERAHKHTGKNRTVLIRHLKDVYGIKAIYTDLVCPSGSYGTWCGMRCGSCFQGQPCDPVTGVCRHGCSKGVVIDPNNMCNTPCTGGTYAQDCSLACGHCKNGAVCNRYDGRCPHGCEDGYTGPTCWEVQHHRKRHNIVKGSSAILGTLIVSFVLVACIIVVVIAVYCWRKRRTQHYQRADDRVEFITEMEEEFRL